MVRGRRLAQIRRWLLGVCFGEILEMATSVVGGYCELVVGLTVDLGSGQVVGYSPLEAVP